MPILSDLVTASDFTDYGYDLAAAAKAASASARVRRFLRQEITPGTSTVTLTGCGPWLLPQRPVTAVDTVVDGNNAEVAFTLDGSRLSSDVCAPLTVTYTHGFNPLPDELVEVVCAIAVRLNGMSGAMAAGVRTEQAGGESITYGADAWSGTTGLTRPEMEALRKIYPKFPRSSILL